MRRKDGKPQLKALRRMPRFDVGFCGGSNAKENGYGTGNHPYTVTSFFSGCGGLDFGFRGGFSVLGRKFSNLPFDILGAYDFLQDAVDCYRLNLDSRIECSDLTKIDASTLPKTDVLIGGFPCQDFSSSGPKTGFEGKRGKLYKVLLNYMVAHRPRVVVGENVIHLARMRNGEFLNPTFRVRLQNQLFSFYNVR